MEHNTNNRVAFILYEYGLGNSPSLINAAKLTADHGYGVDFFTCGTFLGNVQFDRSTITINTVQDVNKPSPDLGFMQKLKWSVIERLRSLSRVLPWKLRIRNEEKWINESIYFFVESALAIMGKSRYKCLIGVEPLGMMAAYMLSKQVATPFAYYNMELHIESERCTPHDFIVKDVEKKLNQFAQFTIAQDSERGQLIAKENGILPERIIPVPVCADGEPFRKKTNYLREIFGLPPETRIILYAGFIAEWAMCAEIAASAQSWPDNWVLVFHTHGYNNENYIKKVRQFENRNVLFSMTPVPYTELPAFLASADIGIAFYRDLGANFTLISSASGKLAHYLQSGLPVVVNSYPGISTVIEQYQCGYAIENPDDLPEAINRIFENYQQMRSGAYRCYEENYRLSRYYSKVLEKIDQL